jgi:hypothetical protein
VLVHALMEIDPRFPTVTKQHRQGLLEIKETLEAQAPEGAAPDPFERAQRDRHAEGDQRSGDQAEPVADAEATARRGR